MILTVTLNPALDLTYGVARLVGGATHRVDTVSARAGGKGVNVARVLRALDAPVLATGLLGGATGDQIATLLRESTVDFDFTPIGGESRRTVVVAEPGTATGFWEAGPEVSTPEWREFLARFAALTARARVVVLAGSLPPGVPDDAYARLTELARAAGARVLLDADGPALRAGLPAGPDVVKPNRAELAELTGHPLASPRQAAPVARSVRGDSPTAVVATLGGDGLVASTVDGDWRAALPAMLPGNATGAGDACAAALAIGLRDGQDWPSMLADAVACAAAAVSAPTAGTVDPARVRQLRDSVQVEAL
jgi:tagatose 6-phosphate kinase